MGRELRFVTADWEPHDEPLFDGLNFPDAVERWNEAEALWAEGKVQWGDDEPEEYDTSSCTLEEYVGRKPDPAYYTATRPGADLTHMVMYEDTSEGTPISPKFPVDQADELAQWLEDTGASAFADYTATKEQWLRTIEAGWAPGAVIVDGVMRSGVEYVGNA